MANIRKTFVISMFGSSFPWIQEFIQHVQHLGAYGWEWKIFTPNTDVQSMGNVEIVPMTTEQFVDLCDKTIGVRPNLFITPDGIPSVHVTDFYVAGGLIFADWLKNSDFWGITNLDVVYGRLDHFIPDHILDQCDIMSDDMNTINGVFSLYRNRLDVNNLFKEIPEWRAKFTLPPCPKCTKQEGYAGNHILAGTDEYDMTTVCAQAAQQNRIKYICPQHYPMHSHDRLEQHVPDVKLEMQSDGSLWELFKDMKPPQWVHARPFLGREIGYFHFPMTKAWPKITQKPANDLPKL